MTYEGKRSKTTARRAAEEGMSLVEVVVALSILMLVLVGTYALVTQSAIINRQARNSYLSATLANSRLERLQNFEYKDLELLAEDQMLIDQFGKPDEYGEFRRTTMIDTNYSEFLTEAVVTVEYKNSKTGYFEGLYESADTLLTKYLEPEEP